MPRLARLRHGARRIGGAIGTRGRLRQDALAAPLLGRRRSSRGYASDAGAGVTFQTNPDNREFTRTMEFLNYDDVPLFRVMDEDGVVAEGLEPGVGKEEAIKMHETMVRTAVMDHILHEAQRQGRLSFYMTASGEEATHAGSASALEPQDVVFAQYREQGVLMYRGFTFQQFCNQCCGNAADPAKGRQMPVHYGSAELNYHTISSPLATQLPHAVGAAYALKLERQMMGGEDTIALCFFGDGAASEGDFHAALNFAATTQSPVVFFCRNNGYAISTPIEEQMASDGIVARGPAYGVPAVRVDGNDVWAVRAAVAEARRMALEESTPVLVEAITYRMGHHSTSDDSQRYRPVRSPRLRAPPGLALLLWQPVLTVRRLSPFCVQDGEQDFWKEQDNPILRMRNYLKLQGWYTDEEEQELRDLSRKQVLEALVAAEKIAPLSPDECAACPLPCICLRKIHLCKICADRGLTEFLRVPSGCLTTCTTCCRCTFRSRRRRYRPSASDSPTRSTGTRRPEV